jgi:2-succinyl-5-enolpyruvyl-6-hydroxy-3-cyclohexene-1-carboxylate synthase
VTSATDTYVLLRAFVDELVRCGMRAACTSPGSRCAPLVITLARERRLQCYSHIDERCAGFFAVGYAKASGLPVAVTCTSGTAAAELLPAAIEAHEARVPLILLTADRPPELRETGAGQAIDQLKLYGSAAKWFFEVGTHDSSPERLRWMRTLACRAYATALEGPSGVVHLNFPLREPLVTDAALPPDSTGRPGGRPYVRRLPAACPPAPIDADAEDGIEGHAAARSYLRALLNSAERGIVVAGRDERVPSAGCPSPGQTAAEFAAAMQWPLLADPMSGARRGEAAIAHYDALLRSAGFTATLDPDLIVRIGDLPVSKPLRVWLAGLKDVRQVALDRDATWQDPAASLTDSLALDHIAAFRAIRRDDVPPRRTRWLEHWRSADSTAAAATDRAIHDSGLSEPAVAAELGRLLPSTATLFVSSSMPIRDIEAYWPVRSEPPRVLCNRGANGIDGIVSTAFGAAAAEQRPTVLFTGDVALAHDLGGLIASRRLGLKLVIVLLDNGGGGIFDFLPIASLATTSKTTLAATASGGGTHRHRSDAAENIYTKHIATPTGLNFCNAATLYAIDHSQVADLTGLRTALAHALTQSATTIIQVRTDRGANLTLHGRIADDVNSALVASIP